MNEPGDLGEAWPRQTSRRRPLLEHPTLFGLLVLTLGLGSYSQGGLLGLSGYSNSLAYSP